MEYPGSTHSKSNKGTYGPRIARNLKYQNYLTAVRMRRGSLVRRPSRMHSNLRTSFSGFTLNSLSVIILGYSLSRPLNQLILSPLNDHY